MFQVTMQTQSTELVVNSQALCTGMVFPFVSPTLIVDRDHAIVEFE
jgi:hypothetical protein